MLSVADGSDMMGSLRNPAAWCDVYGFRPTVGLVAREDAAAVVSPRISTAGPMARDVEDLTAFLTTMAGGAFTGIAQTPDNVRIGWLGDWGGAYPMAPGILDLADAALRVMGDMGWEVEPVAPPVPRELLWDSWTEIRAFFLYQELAPHWRDRAARAALNAQATYECERGLAVTGEALSRAIALRATWLEALDVLFARYDALVLPSTQLWPFPAEWDWPREIAGVAMDTYHRWMEVVVPASLAGVPAIGMPAGHGPDGLPGGIQLIGPRCADARVLALAQAYGAAIGPRAIRL
jgi:amidase